MSRKHRTNKEHQFGDQRNDVAGRVRHPRPTGRVSTKSFTRVGTRTSTQPVNDTPEGHRLDVIRTNGKRMSTRGRKLGVTLAPVRFPEDET